MDSAPNIIGHFLADIRVKTFVGDNDNAFYYTDGPINDYKDSNNTRSGLVHLDASRSNNAYGRRNEVAPANYTIRIWRRVR